MSELAFVRPVDTVSVADRVTNELRSAILTGRLKPGQEFSLRQIAGELGVSFIPVREALRSLEAEGLLLTHRGRSASVAPMTSDEVGAIFRLRRQVEPELAAQAAVMHTPGGLDDIERALTVCDNPSVTAEQHHELHHQAHMDLVRPAMTAWDRRLVETLLRATSRYLRLGITVVGDVTQVTQRQCSEHIEAHRELVDTLRTGKSEQAREIMERHLGEVEQVALGAVAPSD